MVETTVINPAVKVVQFNTLPGVPLQSSGVPRALIRFNENFTFPSTPALETADLILNLDLPPNYFYRPLSIRLTAYSGGDTECADWIDNGPGRIEFQTNAFVSYYTSLFWGIRGRWTGAGIVGFDCAAITSVDDLIWRQIIDGRTERGINPRLIVRTHMNDADNASMAGNIFATFLQYDVAQGLDWPLYYPGNALG